MQISGFIFTRAHFARPSRQVILPALSRMTWKRGEGKNPHCRLFRRQKRRLMIDIKWELLLYWRVLLQTTHSHPYGQTPRSTPLRWSFVEGGGNKLFDFIGLG